MQEVAYGDGVGSVRAGDDRRFLEQAAHAQNRRLRLVDDWRSELLAKNPRVFNGEGARTNFIRLQLLAPRALREIGNRPRNAQEILLLGLLDYRNNESPVQRDCDTDIDVRWVADGIAFHLRIDDRHFAQCHDGCPRDERHVGQLYAIALLVLALFFLAQLYNLRKVDLENRMDMRSRTLRLHHGLRDNRAHLRHWHQLAGSRSGRGRRSRSSGPGRCGSLNSLGSLNGSGLCARALLAQMTKHVFLRDAPACTSSRNLAKVEIVFPRDFSHKRRGANRFTGNLSRRSGSRSWSFGPCWNRRHCSRSSRSSCARRAADYRDYRIDLNSLARGDFNFAQNARRGRRYLSIHLVGRNLKQRLVPFYRIPNLLQPFSNGAFKNGLAHLRHYDICAGPSALSGCRQCRVRGRLGSGTFGSDGYRGLGTRSGSRRGRGGRSRS